MSTKVCKKCGIELPLECYSKNSSSKDKHYNTCKECEKQRHKEYRKAHPEKNKKYKEEHKEQIKEYRRTDKYKTSNKIRNYNRRMKTKQGKGLRSYEIEQEILTDWFNNSCAYSNKELTNETINWDHIIPLKRNGVNEIWNLIPSYYSYNCRKGAKEPYKWYKEQDYYNDERLEYIIYYQKVMYWNFANKDNEPLVLITGETLTYKDIENEYGMLEGAK